MSTAERIEVIGVEASASARYISENIKNHDRVFLIAATAEDCMQLAAALEYCTKKETIVLSKDLFFGYESRDRQQEISFLRAVKRIASQERCMVIATPFMINTKVSSAVFKSALTLAMGQDISREDVEIRLAELGYERRQNAYEDGEYAVRGGIIDVMQDGENGVRIEFFGDCIDGIRKFDIKTQRSSEALESIDIESVSFANGDEDSKIDIIDIVSPDAIFIEQPDVVAKSCIDEEQKFQKTILNLRESKQISEEDILDHMALVDMKRMEQRLGIWQECDKPKNKAVYYMSAFDIPKGSFYYGKPAEVVRKNAGVIRNFIDSKELKNFIERHEDEGFTVRVMAKDEYSKVRLQEHFGILGITVDIFTFGRADEFRGFIDNDEHLCLLTEKDIFGVRVYRAKRNTNESIGERLSGYQNIEEGDYLVHKTKGIGRYTGIKTMKLSGRSKDYICLVYAQDDKLYVPVENANVLSKYSGASDATPKLSKLFTNEWSVTKKKAWLSVLELAKKILEDEAKRKAKKGYAFSPDDEESKKFDADFSYIPTDDQLRAIDEVKADMESPSPMDRLLCGDVGYGKTEVAARAMYKCIAAGKQVAFLAPTTILVNQHYKTLVKRFEKTAAIIGELSRFRTDVQQKKIIEDAKVGKVDILIGTHRMLSQDIGFQDLGLLIIDEEQRFGVVQKEKIRRLRQNVDVLTLSATPIPRTMHMAISGARDLSLITHPPLERMPVNTFVYIKSDEVMREAIEREVARKGQVYVVCRRISHMQDVKEKIERLVKGIRVDTVNGQMNEKHIEDTLSSFIAGEIDVLVCTKIIETGIDIKNANTIIILDADMMGIAELYQLRGRVGRGNRSSFAYLLHNDHKKLSDEQKSRLTAIKEFAKFGSSLTLAMKDMQIRGAGDIIGKQQHGHMISIGYEMYIKLIEDAVKALNEGREIEIEDEVECEMSLDIEAYIPKSYIHDTQSKLMVYRKIAGIQTDEEFQDVKEYIEDMFGRSPENVRKLMELSFVKNKAARCGISKVRSNEFDIIVEYISAKSLQPHDYSALAGEFKDVLKIGGYKHPILRFNKAQYLYKYNVDLNEEPLDVVERIISIHATFQRD